MREALDWAFWLTGAAIWTLGGIVTSMIAVLYLIELIARMCGWYKLLNEGIEEAFRRRLQKKNLTTLNMRR